MDGDRTLEVLRRAEYAWTNRLLAFSTMEPPESWHLPEEVVLGSRLHALCIFMAGYFSRSGKLADDVIPKAFRMVVERPDLADPKRLRRRRSQADRDYVGELIAFAKVDPVRIDHYFQSLETLRDEYNGDPRNIFLTVPEVDDLMEAREFLVKCLDSKKFPGIGNKIAQLIVIWFQDTEWKKVRNHPQQSLKWEWIRGIPSFPVDIWIMRLFRQFGMVVEWQTDHRDAVSKLSSKYLSELCHKNNISQSMVAQALWHTGSRLCNRSKHKSDVGKSVFCLTQCPLYELCEGRVGTNAKTRARGSLGWGELFVPHNRVFSQDEMSEWKIPDNDGKLYLKPKKPKTAPKLEIEESPLMLFDSIER